MRCFRMGCENEATRRVTYTRDDGGTPTFSDLCADDVPAADVEIVAPYTARTVGDIPEPEPEPEPEPDGDAPA